MTVRNAGYDDFLDAVETGDPYYLQSEDGKAYLPPLGFDPSTGAESLAKQPLPDQGTILTHTTTNVALPQFADQAPYISAIAEFGPVRLTGQIRADLDAIDIGTTVELDVATPDSSESRVLLFKPV